MNYTYELMKLLEKNDMIKKKLHLLVTFCLLSFAFGICIILKADISFLCVVISHFELSLELLRNTWSGRLLCQFLGVKIQLARGICQFFKTA